MQHTLELLDRLVAFDTVSARSNLALIDWAADHLRVQGITAEVIPSDCGNKASLFATMGPATDGGVVLSGHSDVVPTEGQAWTSDPFRLVVRDGRAFGRGACDMKGFIACALTAAREAATRPLQRPLHVALTFDEEVGCTGAPELIDWLATRRPRPGVVIVGEPTSMRPVDAHKGMLVASTVVTGAQAHSSLAHEGVSAVQLAARGVMLLGEIEMELAATRHHRFIPDRATISVNLINGGTAINILAGTCRFDWDVRAVPGVTARTVVADFEARFREALEPFRARFPNVGATTTVFADAPALEPDEDGAAMRLVTTLTGANAPEAVAFAAEAGLYQAAGLSAVVIGPGSIEQAHKADEYVSLEQLAECGRFVNRLVHHLER